MITFLNDAFNKQMKGQSFIFYTVSSNSLYMYICFLKCWQKKSIERQKKSIERQKKSIVSLFQTR